jgi:hypothetical protein
MLTVSGCGSQETGSESTDQAKAEAQQRIAEIQKSNMPQAAKDQRIGQIEWNLKRKLAPKHQVPGPKSPQ